MDTVRGVYPCLQLCVKKKPGHHQSTMQAGTIQGYVLAVRLLRSREAGWDMAPEMPGGPLALALKRMRQLDPPTGTSRLSRGFRASHFWLLLVAVLCAVRG